MKFQFHLAIKLLQYNCKCALGDVQNTIKSAGSRELELCIESNHLRHFLVEKAIIAGGIFSILDFTHANYGKQNRLSSHAQTYLTFSIRNIVFSNKQA